MLKEVITKYYSDLRKEMGQHHFYITDAGKCQRAIFFRFKKAPAEAMEPRLLMIFDHGDHIHQMIMKALFGARKMHVVAAEVNIPPQEIVSGRADAILSDGKDLYVLDIKSINGQIFRNLSSPKSDHINQVQLYLHFFKLKKGILLYVNKDTQELKEFLVDYNQQICEYLLRELSLLKDKIEKNIVPPRISNLSDKWQCQYCQFKEICKIAGPEEVDWNLFKRKIEAISSMRTS